MNKKNLFKILGVLPYITTSYFYIACSNNDSNNNISINKEKNNNTYELDVLVKKFSNNTNDKSQLYPTDLNSSEFDFEIKGENANNFYVDNIELDFYFNQKGKNISDWLGALDLIVNLKNNNDKNINIKKILKLNGFKHNPLNGDKVDLIFPSPFDEIRKNYTEYKNLSHNQIFDLENEEYMNALQASPMVWGDKHPKEYRKDLDLTNLESIKKFDNLAKSINIDSYSNWYTKGHTLPKYDKNGNFLGLSIYDGQEIGKGHIRADFLGTNQWRAEGLPRMLVNDMYKKIAMQTFGIEFTNDNSDGQSFGTSGTLWILDFEKTKDGSYPTKWFFATNLHVADSLLKDTKNVIITKISSNANLNDKFSISTEDDKFEKFFFKQKILKNNFITKIFEGNDFLKTKPSDFLYKEQAEKYKNAEEYADLAILEFDFSKAILEDGIWAYSSDRSNDIDIKYSKEKNNAELLAKLITNNYANNKSVHISFLKKSYMEDYDKINKKIIYKRSDNYNFNGDSLYALGFPVSENDYFLLEDGEEGSDLYNKRKESLSIWTNSESRFYNNLTKENLNKKDFSKDILDQGDYLSQNIGYRTFSNKPGIIDAFLTANHIGNNLYLKDNQNLISFGLNYAIKNYVPYGGSSGSSFRNQNNELIGIFHSANSSGKVGLVASFRSEGYNYNGLFGNYNMPQYDLIYGGGKDQRKSYREELLKKYPSLKTNLFPEGLNIYDEDYKFK
ncbi:putative lipoprotein [Mycoplasmopsis maculosa]|uniref:Putative lipoprotein n=1 Tax=Mycoplasmopsis maculosa TaxID=114885 RepID=A0A449B570_9BACT|nr:DUF31 family protein [Mycoplasmopsis maculosa]VEU75716.1 putative lipoprotein [Mycoplasmopsis maculosa]